MVFQSARDVLSDTALAGVHAAPRPTERADHVPEFWLVEEEGGAAGLLSDVVGEAGFDSVFDSLFDSAFDSLDDSAAGFSELELEDDFGA
jgi:hypothetical protein